MTTTIPAGIAAQDFNCWQLVHPSTGHPLSDGDCEEHFDTEAKAEQRLRQLLADGDDIADYDPQELTSPCWIATAACGYRLDEEGSAVMHHDTAEEATKTALDCGFLVSPSGALACSTDCDEEATR